jgi:nucleolar protein 12
MSQLSDFFGDKIITNNSSGKSFLSHIFSEDSKEKFARVIKPEEFQKKKKDIKEALPNYDSEEELKKSRLAKKLIKKQKRKDANEEAKAIREKLQSKSDGNIEKINFLPTKLEQKQKQDNCKENNIKLKSTKIEDKKEIESIENIDIIDESVPLVSDPSKSHVTIFIGNIPKTESIKSLTKFCSKFGAVESCRLRSVPVAGTAVDEKGNFNLVRKVCANSGLLGDQKGSFNAYVVFKHISAVEKALKANNEILGIRHLRIDTVNPSLFDPKRSVFIGNLPHYTDEEDLRNHFVKVLPNGQKDIEGIRLVRDPETLIGKGIGYMLLSDRDSVLQALTLHQQLYKKRELRITICGKRTKRTLPVKEISDKKTKRDCDDDKEDRPSKKPKKEKESAYVSKNLAAAAKRIKIKNVATRNKVMKEKGQKKSQPGRKGKRLGGVVKRAMKAEKSSKKQ